MKNRIIKVIFIFMVCFLLLFGCSSQNDKSNSSQSTAQPSYQWGTISGKTITVWGDKDDLSRPYMLRSFERYQEATGNTVKTVELNKQDLNELVPKTFASGTSVKPDILLSYGGTNVENLNPDEYFYDFTEAPWVDDLTDTAINQAIFNGKVIGLPHGEASVSGMLYNKQIFKKFGIEIPKTQDEFLQVCETLLQNGIVPVYLPYAEITMLLYQFPMDSFLTDRDILNGLNDGTLSYAEIPEMKKIVQWYKTMSDQGYFGEDYMKNDWDGMDTAMKNGEYAMMLCWDTWIYTSFTGDPSTIGLMPAFMGHPENGCFEGANVVLCIVNRKSGELDASLDLINFMADPVNYNIAFAGLYTAPVYNQQKGSVTTPQYMESERLIDKLFYDSTAWSRVRGFSQIDASFIQQYMQNETSLEECLRLMDDARTARAGIFTSEEQ